jgi:hypothetical protein
VLHGREQGQRNEAQKDAGRGKKHPETSVAGYQHSFHLFAHADKEVSHRSLSAESARDFRALAGTMAVIHCDTAE